MRPRRRGHYEQFGGGRAKCCTTCGNDVAGRYHVDFFVSRAGQKLVAPSETSHETHVHQRTICQRCINVIATQSTHWTAD